jgi:putative DNA primase/helicase
MTAPSRLGDALKLAAAGLPVFPCGPDKRPRVKWRESATSDPEVLRQWWCRWPDSLPAVPMGEPSDLWMLDLDISPDGEPLGERTAAALGIVPAEHPHAIRTRRGGWHLPFRWRDGLPGNTAHRRPGIDSRGEGGYCIAWDAERLAAAATDQHLPEPPESLLDALDPLRPEPPRANGHPHGTIPDAYVRAAVDAECRAVASAPEGQRNDTLNRAAFALGQLVGAHALGRREAEARLLAAALTCGLDHREADATIRSGLDGGEQHPRQIEPREPRQQRQHRHRERDDPPRDDQHDQPRDEHEEPPREEDAELRRLAALTPIAYDREREAAAKRLGVRVGTLDAEVAALRPKDDVATGRGVALPEAEPWPLPVAGAALIEELAKTIRRHVVLPQHVADVLAAWIVHTYVAECFQHTPRLGITSPTKRCGKSTLLQVLTLLCRRVLKADNISASGIFRTVEALAPLTLLIDEADTFLRDNEELRGILNSGFERGGEVIRVVEIQGEHQPIRFRTFAPCAIAAIGSLPATIEDRSIPVTMQRRGAAEVVEKLRAPGARKRLAELAAMCARWAADHGPHLDLDPQVPDALNDREGDIAIPLLSIADAAGADWPVRIRNGLIAMFGHRQGEDRGADVGTLLLGDIKIIFLELSATRLPSSDIVDRLNRMEHRPWPEWRHGKPMSAPQLARALAPFGVRPGTIRQAGAGTIKGYYREAFEEAWGRYLPSDSSSNPSPPPSEPSHRHNQGNSKVSGDSQAVTPDPVLRIEIGRNAAENLGCDAVTVSHPPLGGEGGSEGSDDPFGDDGELI